ncbi:methionyl-tRNA formyltransferase [Conchiformibius steedae DSM 2580]|uniref:Methionyl-tRNA formyltransferase n=1 Tax=Conchiformibius steedae DSM 2580 TaxID=1121352 RepID=A0AAE9HXV5_9NEIS|nr:methionyl-tRNA formyltransferase [Conchiformibius steedae]QMT33711.1 methionyl-tRNA formyltransferase [Conchiformibius steedae]URD68372.1 methionyl-tRNA formyltransferase [Conchiformibius steedae DSM 2580]
MKVAFAGTPEFAAAALRAVAAEFELPLVLTQPDRPKGRGMALQASPVKQAAQALGLRVEQPQSLRGSDEIPHLLKALDIDVMVVAAYGLILPQSVLDAPKHGCLNIHASLLPRWRGAAPIQRAIEAGDAETGVCIMQMDAGLDTGAVVSEHRLVIGENDTAADVHDALMQLGAAAVVADLRRLRDTGQLNAVPQPEQGISYATKLNKEEAQIDWSQPADVLARKIRAFNPVPAAWTLWEGKPLKIWLAHSTLDTGAAGEILAADSKGILVGCGTGALRIESLQPAGGKRMNAAAFAAGRSQLIGECLGK